MGKAFELIPLTNLFWLEYIKGPGSHAFLELSSISQEEENRKAGFKNPGAFLGEN